MYHSFLIHLSASGCLGCFRVLAVVNSVIVYFCKLIFTSRDQTTLFVHRVLLAESYDHVVL